MSSVAVRGRQPGHQRHRDREEGVERDHDDLRRELEAEPEHEQRRDNDDGDSLGTHEQRVKRPPRRLERVDDQRQRCLSRTLTPSPAASPSPSRSSGARVRRGCPARLKIRDGAGKVAALMPDAAT
jgi:hypothetical protein